MKSYVCFNLADHAWPVCNRYIGNALLDMWENGSRPCGSRPGLDQAGQAAWMLAEAFAGPAGLCQKARKAFWDA